MTLHVKDISKHQGEADVRGHIRAGNPALIIRAHSGFVQNVQFDDFREEAHDAGVRVLGLYQYLESGRDAVVQAREFCAAVEALRPGEFALLDLEEGNGAQGGRASAWLQHVDEHLGGRAWVYSGESFATTHRLADLIRHRPSIVAAYRTGPPPRLGQTMWQHTNGTHPRHVDPQLGRVDCSVFDGGIADLLAIVHGATAHDAPLAHATPKPHPATSRPHPAPPAQHLEDDMTPEQAAQLAKVAAGMDALTAAVDRIGTGVQKVGVGIDKVTAFVDHFNDAFGPAMRRIDDGIKRIGTKVGA